MKLILGLANFGKSYGINKYQVPRDEALRILDYARKVGIEYLETSTAYDVPDEYLNGFKVIMKVQNYRPKGDYTIMAHGFEYMKDGIFNVSVDTPEEACKAIATSMEMIELPYNIFDNRFEFTAKVAHRMGIKIMARSVYLQGLLLMDKSPPNINAQPYLDQFGEIAHNYGLTRQEAALLFVASNDNIDYAVIGVDNVDQLKQNVETIEKWKLSDTSKLKDAFKDVPDEIRIPALWRV
jgi:aryl-alcohol dehydrogenase-like predicted oxidoreductase